MGAEILIDASVRDNLRARCVFETIFNVTGMDHQFVDSFKNGPDNIFIYYGPDLHFLSTADVVIEYMESEDWKMVNPDVTFIDDVPVFYISGKPQTIYKDKRFGFDIIKMIFYFLSRQEEHDYGHRDKWGCFSGTYSILYESGIAGKPFINKYIRIFESILDRVAGSKGIKLFKKPLWKDNKQFCVILSHDVDGVNSFNYKYGLQSIRALAKDLSPQNIMNQSFQASYFFINSLRRDLFKRKDPMWCFEKWCEIEEKYDFRSTFFFEVNLKYRDFFNDGAYQLNETLRFNNKRIKVRELMRYLYESGFEIGLHGSYNSFVNSSYLKQEKQSIEQVIQDEVAGIRQHCLRFDIANTWRCQQEAGIRYDSTLGYNEIIGYRCGMGFPFYPYDLTSEKKLDILELPLTIMDAVLFRFENLRLDEEKAYGRCIKILDEIESTGGLAVLLWHPNTVDERYYPGWFKVYSRILEYLSTRNCWVTSSKEVLNWWKYREKSLCAE